MKAISVQQPWASRISSGEKWLEIRSWRTEHRGPLLICVSRRPRIDSLPSGVALCIVDVVDCHPMTPADEAGSGVAFRPGLFAWVLGKRRPVEPFAVSGRLGIFDVDVQESFEQQPMF